MTALQPRPHHNRPWIAVMQETAADSPMWSITGLPISQAQPDYKMKCVKVCIALHWFGHMVQPSSWVADWLKLVLKPAQTANETPRWRKFRWFYQCSVQNGLTTKPQENNKNSYSLSVVHPIRTHIPCVQPIMTCFTRVYPRFGTGFIFPSA